MTRTGLTLGALMAGSGVLFVYQGVAQLMNKVQQ
jgi:hypothetical protein